MKSLIAIDYVIIVAHLVVMMFMCLAHFVPAAGLLIISALSCAFILYRLRQDHKVFEKEEEENDDDDAIDAVPTEVVS